MTATPTHPSPARLRFGQIVRYEGSITSERGGWFRVSGTRVDSDPAGTTSSPTSAMTPAAPCWRPPRIHHPGQDHPYKCRECHLEHYIERGQPKGTCGLAALPDAAL